MVRPFEVLKFLVEFQDSFLRKQVNEAKTFVTFFLCLRQFKSYFIQNQFNEIVL